MYETHLEKLFVRSWCCQETRADNLVPVKFGFSALSVPHFFGI